MTKSTFPDDNKSALEIIRELTSGEDLDDESHNTLPISVHTQSLSPNKAKPDPLLPHSAKAEEQPFTNEIDSLQFALQRLQLSFPRVTSIEENLKLAVVYPASFQSAQPGICSALKRDFLEVFLAGP